MKTKELKEAEFTTFDEKREIHNHLIEKGVNENIIHYLFDEIQRLESIIRDYQVGMMQVVFKLESKTMKQPNTLKK